MGYTYSKTHYLFIWNSHDGHPVFDLATLDRGGVSVHLGLSVLRPPKQGVWGAGASLRRHLPESSLTISWHRWALKAASPPGADLKAPRSLHSHPYPKWDLLFSILLQKHGSRFQMLLCPLLLPPGLPVRCPAWGWHLPCQGAWLWTSLCLSQSHMFNQG